MEENLNLPQYRRLYEVLRKHIMEGVYKEGDLLPSENELCRIYGLTRPTVRHALDTLVNEGFIAKHKGKGSIVHQIPNGIGILSISGTTSAIGKGNLQTQIIHKPEITAWPEPFMYSLTAEEKEFGCIYMKRLRFVNQQPVFYDTNYIPNINLPRFCKRSFEGKSLFDMLRKHYEIEVKNGEQKLRAIPANEELAHHFKTAIGKPVLHLERKMQTNRKGFYIYSSIYCNTENYFLYGAF